MSGADDPTRLGNLPVGYVTQSQLQEAADQITQQVEAQFKSFTDEFFSHFPTHASPPAPSAAPRASASRHSTSRDDHQLAMQQVQQPITPHVARPRRECQEHASQQLQMQLAPHANPSRRLPFHEATAESPGPGHRMTTSARDVPRSHHAALAPSAREPTDGYDRAHQPISDAIGGNTPFTDSIMQAPIEKFKMPTMEKYKGEGDPAEHVQNYYDTMIMLQAPEAVICRCFPVTLAGSAKLWWNALEKKSIGSFEELSRKFIHHFLADSKQKLPSHVLIHTKQEPDEDLRTYIKRFQVKRLEVEDPGSRVAMAAMVAGLRSSDFSKYLSRKPVRSFEHLMAKAHGYMNMEDAEAYKASEIAESSQTAKAAVPHVTPKISSPVQPTPLAAPTVAPPPPSPIKPA